MTHVKNISGSATGFVGKKIEPSQTGPTERKPIQTEPFG